jgi:hypothetical protein
MKKFIIPILMLCLGYAGMTKAANTDISTLNNIIYVEPFNAAAGAQVQVSIKMKNSAAIRGFQFDLFLPDGVTAAKSTKGKILASLTENRLPDEDEHTLTLSEQGDGSIRFLCGSLADETFTGTDGEIATLTINIDGGVANGNYSVFLKNMKLTETDISNFYETESIETTLTVGGKSYTILDELSTTPPAAATGVDVRVKRTINANSWSTICLPFAIPAEKMTAAFGAGVEVKDFTAYDIVENGDDIVGITISFQPVTAIEANHPYLIKVANAIAYNDGFTVDNVNINPEAEPVVSFGFTTGKGSKAVYHPADFIGTYVANTTVPENDLFISNNKFHYSAGLTKMKAFRAYFEFDDVLTAIDEASSRIMLIDSEITGIIEHRGKMSDNIYYDLQGRKIENPGKGLYINNGRKVVKR